MAGITKPLIATPTLRAHARARLVQLMMPFQATVATSCFGWYPTMHRSAHPHGYGTTSLRRGLSTLITTLFIKLQIYGGDTRSRIASFMMKAG